MIKISPSILSADFAHLGRDIEAISTADYVHVDVMDGLFVPNISIGIPVVKCIRPVTKLPLDVHLMIDRPVRYVPAAAFQIGGRRADTCRSPLEIDIHMYYTNLLVGLQRGKGPIRRIRRSEPQKSCLFCELCKEGLYLCRSFL